MEEILKQNNESKSHKEFSELLSKDLKGRSFVEGGLIVGTVEEISKKYVFIDLGLKSSGAIPIEEFTISNEKVVVGDKIKVLLERIEHPRTGEVIVSRQKARRQESWKRLEASFDKKEDVTGVIVSKVKGGLAVSVESCICFLPGSQVDTKPLKNFNNLMKIPLTFEIVKMDKRRGNVILSRRSVLEKIRDKDKEKHMKDLKEGMILKNCVCKSIQSWGAFFSYESLDFLVHINELSWSRVSAPSDLLQVGQTCDVYLYKIDGKRISGSLKRLQPDPYIDAVKKYKPGMIVKNCTVNQIREYGAFVLLEPNLSGLVHVSQLDELNPNIAPQKVLSVSEKIPVKILSIDAEERKISLSYKDCFPSPWITFKEKYKVNDIVSCKVKQKNDYGIFCYIEDTPIVGLLHVSNLEYDSNKREEKLNKIFKNDILKCKIYEVNDEKMRCQLSIKHMESDPFDLAFEKRKVSDVITVIVQSTTQNGIYVNFGKNDLSIFIKKNQLAAEPENQRTNIYQRGNKIDVVITELQKDTRKVTLSVKKLIEQETTEAIKKYGSKDSGGKIADLFNFSSLKTNKKEKKK